MIVVLARHSFVHFVGTKLRQVVIGRNSEITSLASLAVTGKSSSCILSLPPTFFANIQEPTPIAIHVHRHRDLRIH